MTQKHLHLCSILFVVFVCSGATVKAATSADSNTYMGTVIMTHLMPELKHQGLDPAPLPAFDSSLRDTFLRIGVNVKVNYRKGQLTGLSGVTNLGNCTAPVKINDNFTIVCYLSFRELEVKHDATLKYGQIPNIQIHASAKVRDTTIVTEITTSPSNNIPFMRQFDVREIGVVTPKFTGVGPLNRYLSMLTDTFLSNTTQQLLHLLNGRFRDILAKTVGQVQMPTD